MTLFYERKPLEIKELEEDWRRGSELNRKHLKFNLILPDFPSKSSKLAPTRGYRF